MTKFKPMSKIGRLSRTCTVTEKIDGTNASIYIGEDGEFLTGSRTRWITPTDDNYGFSRWAHANKEELLRLGPGHHFGEWWGLGIQRNYGLKEKRFSLFNTGRWTTENVPKYCYIVPVLYEGSQAAPGFMKPEGIVVYHHATKTLFKKTIEKDEQPKGNKE